MSRHDDAVRLRHLLEAARKAVALAAAKARVDIEADEVVQLALARLLEIVGEAAGKVTPAWAAMGGLRNRLAHAYFDVDLDVLLDIVANDLPALIRQVEGLLPGDDTPR